MPILPDPDRDELFVTIRDSGHLADGTFEAALDALLPAYRGLLPEVGRSAPRLFTAIQQLNLAGRTIDGNVPLVVVLGTLTKLSPVAAVTSLSKRLLAIAEGKSGLGGAVEYKAASPEAYVGDQDETLPFAFMLGGHTVGRAVLRLLVPRFEGGQAARDGLNQRVFKGTGWLIAKDLVITNFHVVCARESDEADPAPEDLALQIAGITVERDYDSEGAAAVKVGLVERVASGARGGERDYAILRVAAADAEASPWPATLRLRRGKPSIPATGYAINIVQHPQGWPKRVAARSNLLKQASATELQYLGDTLGGSSGSPLCNDAWEVVGLHRASGPATGVSVKGRPATAYNIGIPIDTILDDLKAKAPGVFTEIEPNVLP